MFNFGLVAQSANFQKENTILVQPKKDNYTASETVVDNKQSVSRECLDNGQGIGAAGSHLASSLGMPFSQEDLIFNQFVEMQLNYLSSCLNSQEQKKENLPQAPQEEVSIPETASACKKMFFFSYLERKGINVGTMIRATMPKVCVTTAITSMAEQRSLGTAPITNFMRQGCAKTAISTTTTGKNERAGMTLLRWA